MLQVSKGNPKPGAPPLVLPKSKSIANRLLILNLLYDCPLPLDLGEARDTQILMRALQQVQNTGIVNIEDAGTAMRFLTAALSVRPGQYRLLGTARMHERPMAPLLLALKSLGADIHCEVREGFAPLSIRGKLLKASSIAVDTQLSSQFISALLMVAPALQCSQITMNGPVVSRPYIALTAQLMQNMGWPIAIMEQSLHIGERQSTYAPSIEVEPDWSGIAYWYSLVALSPEPIKISCKNFKPQSLQADAVCERVFFQLGVLTEYTSEGLCLSNKPTSTVFLEWNCRDCPDLVPALICCCAALGISAKLKGVSHLAYKESNRLEALKRELGRRGFQLRLDEDLLFLPASNPIPIHSVISSYQDHRLIMCFIPWIVRGWTFDVPDPETVHKSYPSYWDHLKQLGFDVLLLKK